MSSRFFLVALTLLAVQTVTVTCFNPSTPQTLVLLDSNTYHNTHSTFFSQLKARGHELTFHHIYDENIRLEKYGSFHYDNLVLFAPTAEDLSEGISVPAIVSFIDSGRSVLIAVHENVTEPLRELANECGIDIDEEKTMVVDHINYDSSDSGAHTLVASSNYINAPSMIGTPSAPVLFRGIGHAAAEGSSFLTRVLTGMDSSYSHSPYKRVDEYPQSTGRDTLLVTALQTRNNARVVFSGSLDLFSNQMIATPVTVGDKHYAASGNGVFVDNLSRWVFHERGFLRATQVTHKRVDRDEINPASYRVSDKVEFSTVIEEFDGVTKTWKPFSASDVQLEVVMIDPYIRTALKGDSTGRYSTVLQVPDVYGVYKFVIDYSRVGYSSLQVSEQVSVHPFRHNEFERFIDVAYPYYISVFTMMAAFFLFGLLFLYQKD